MKNLRLVCAGLCLMLCAITVSAQVKLSFNPEMGTKYEYFADVVQNIKQSVMGQEMLTEMQMKSTYLMEIKSKTPQEIKVQFTYSDFIISVSSAMINMKYDSKKPIENPTEMDKMLEKILKELINKPFEVVFAPDGSVKSVTGMEAIIENMLKAVAADGQMGALIGAQMSQQFSDESMKSSFSQSFNFYPENAVKIGDSWNVKNKMLVSGMNLDSDMKNTLKGVNGNMATIEIAGDINMTMEGGKLSGKQTGTMIVDSASGIPETSDVTQNISGSINMQGMDIQTEMTTKTKTSAKVIK
jgi:hypothetical protein